MLQTRDRHATDTRQTRDRHATDTRQTCYRHATDMLQTCDRHATDMQQPASTFRSDHCQHPVLGAHTQPVLEEVLQYQAQRCGCKQKHDEGTQPCIRQTAVCQCAACQGCIRQTLDRAQHHCLAFCSGRRPDIGNANLCWKGPIVSSIDDSRKASGTSHD